MDKLFSKLKKISKNDMLVSMALAVVAISEAAVGNCVVWVIGQEDMPEELL